MTAQQNTAEPEPAGVQRLLLSREEAGRREERVRWHQITLPGPGPSISSCTTLDKTPNLAVLPGPHLCHGDAKCSLLWGCCDGTRGCARNGTPPLRSARSARSRQAAFGESVYMPGGQAGKEIVLGSPSEHAGSSCDGQARRGKVTALLSHRKSFTKPALGLLSSCFWCCLSPAIF